MTPFSRRQYVAAFAALAVLYVLSFAGLALFGGGPPLVDTAVVVEERP